MQQDGNSDNSNKRNGSKSNNRKYSSDSNNDKNSTISKSELRTALIVTVTAVLFIVVCVLLPVLSWPERPAMT